MRLQPSARKAVRELAGAHPAPDTPWTSEYVERHRLFVAAVLDTPPLMRRFVHGRRLPSRYAVGYDERTVEFPWLLGQAPRGRTLDAGSALNHKHVLDRVEPLVDDLIIVTLAPEELSFPERRVSYVYADFRALPFPDATFDTIVSVSSLEHVGMDNSIYGAGGEPAADPSAELDRAAAELRRVLRPGGLVLATVPFGAKEDHGWLRQFDGEDVERLIAAFQPRRRSVSVYAYSASGWQTASARSAASASYRDFTRDPTPVADRAVAARAVACIRIET